jgi:ATP-binding cassette subfamily F protein 3
LKRAAEKAEAHVNQLTERLRDLDHRLADPQLFRGNPAQAAQLAKERGMLAKTIEEAEEKWLAAEEAYERARAAAGL